MKYRGTKASGSFDCSKMGSFELLVHMEADPHCYSYAEFDFRTALPCKLARELDDVAAYQLRHRSGGYVVCAEPARAQHSTAFRDCWHQLDTVLFRRTIWLYSATPADLRREPQWSSALQIARAAQTDIDPSDYERVVAYLSAVGPARLRDCLRHCGAGADSFDAILGLISSGVIFLDPPNDLSLAGEVRLDPPPTVDPATIRWLRSAPAARSKQR